MNITAPHFAEPRWLWLALLGPVLLIALQVYAARARRRQLAQIAAPDFMANLTRSHSPARRMLKHVLLLLAVAGIGLALARPQWGVREIASQNFSEDIVFAIDCSRSMLAADVSPNRLERAKLAVQDFVRRHTNGRVGLVAFSGQAFLQCPLTFDHGAFEDALVSLDEKTIVVPGTDVGRALDESFQAMEKMDRKKVIVLITDGEDLEKSGVKIAKSLAETNVVVFTVGVGTEAGAEIRVMNEQGQPEFVRDAKGEVVRSRLDEATLRAIAQTTKGSYEPLGALGEGLAKVRLAVEAKDFDSGGSPTQRYGVDRFHFFVAVVLLLLIVESLVGTRRRNVEGRRKKEEARPGGSIVLVLGFLLLGTGSGFAADETNALVVTNAMAFTNAIIEKTPETAREFFNAGTRRLSEGKLREAEGFFQSALTLQDERYQAPTLHNLGHVRYEQGAEELKKSPESQAAMHRAETALEHGDAALSRIKEVLPGNDLQSLVGVYLNGRGARRELREATDLVRRAIEAHGATLLKWQRALGDFQSALELNPNDADAKRNIAIIEEAIAKLLDKLRQMAQMAQMMGEMRAELGKMMSQLLGKIPAPNAPPGDDGEDDEDDAQRPKGPKDGQQEGRGRDGDQKQRMSPEEAGWLLNSFKLGGDRRLPMGQGGDQKKPKDNKGKNW